MKHCLSSAVGFVLLFASISAEAQIGKPDGTPPHALPNLSMGSHLFVDDYLIDSSQGLIRTTHQPEKLPKPILENREWYRQALWHLKVLRDQESMRFRMWFVATPKVVTDGNDSFYAYAESKDGIRWTQPNLGLMRINGSTDNNAVTAPAYSIAFVDHGPEYSDHDKRFVLFYLTKDKGRRKTSIMAKYSADGLHFREHPGNPLLEMSADMVSDRLAGCWDPLRKRYLMTIGYRGKPEHGFRGKPRYYWEGYRRMVGQTSSNDLVHWTEVKPVVVVDPEEPGFPETYGMTPMVRGSLYLGLLRVLRDDLPADKNGPVMGVGWTQLCTSRDGEHWTQHPDIFLDRSHEPGAWDHAMAWAADVVTVGDKDYIYYGGYEKGHKVGSRRIGVAIMRRNGFVSRDAGPDGGRLRTPLFIWNAKKVEVNAKVDGELRVRLLAESGLPIPGFFWRDCEPIHGDSVRHSVKWKGDPRALKGRLVRLEFYLRETQLYGFDLAD